jgi:D-3-phosphoglycerate dehydrogenase
MKVLVSDSLSERGIEILKKAGMSVDVKTKLAPADLIKEIPQYDGLVIRSGLDNVDIPAATKRGIVVMNTPGGNTITTAEHALSLILSLARQIPQATASVKSGKWEKNKFMGVELFNKTLGVVGLGQIGGYVAKLGQGLNMNVIAYDAFLSPEQAKKVGVELVPLDDLLSRSDIITLHAPLTPETKHLINAQSIAKMKPGVRLINCARGGIVNEKDLYDALVGGKVSGAAFDVFEKEPVDPTNPLLKLDNFICTPHLGAATNEAQENVAWAIAEQIVDYLVHGVVRYAVNLPSVPPDLLTKVQPYLTLAEKLGAFAGQICEGGIEKISIEYRGEVADLATAPITVNYVNAPAIAKERGIEVKESKIRHEGDFSTLVILKVEAGGKITSITGTLFNRVDPRIVEVDGMALEVIPEGPMLFLSNNDKPGVIGGIGTFLGENNVNISGMQLGRERAGGKAISVVGIDTPIPAEVLRRIKDIPNVLSVKQIKL